MSKGLNKKLRNQCSSGWKVWWDVCSLSWLIPYLPTKAPSLTYIPNFFCLHLHCPRGATKKRFILRDISVLCLRGQVVCDVECQTPGLQSPTPTCAIRKTIRSNQTLLANYRLSEGGSLLKWDLQSKPTCAALSPLCLSLQGFIRCSPSLFASSTPKRIQNPVQFLNGF